MSITANAENIKAIVLDLDGTALAPGGKLNERTIRAVKACSECGLKVIINTGRTVDSAEPFRAALGIEGLMIYCNGAMIFDMPEDRPVRTILLDKEVASFCARLAKDLSVYCQVFFPSDKEKNKTVIITESESPEREMYFNHAGRRAVLGDLKEILSRPDLDGCIKAMFLAEPDVLESLRLKIDERFGNSIYMALTLKTFLEVMNAGVSKGNGLQFVMDQYSLKREEVLAFGDEENDLPMFAVAGFSAAPENAKESVKAAAGIVIGSNAEDGVAAFLEETFRL
ncbi:MAG: Cof-type HAD-IIB family hydrolase [Treponema sp.]|jgi:Cof subfamily protein (haloacid dehalogenase superfamily)|nr:Cof-type HAD-IIB family hydrolase [Treponema sp.]